MRIVFATHEELPGGTDDDALAIAALRRLAPDRSVESVPWTSISCANRNNPDGVVVRSCWDYHVRLPEFVDWIAYLEASGVQVINPPRLLRWNTNKGYLRELESYGVPVVPTRWIEPGAGADLAGLLEDAGWTKAVIKPAVGASSHQTLVVRPETAAQAGEQLLGSANHPGYLVQPFMEEIASAGEWSLMFLSGEFSHAVLKRPAVGDFRVQEEFAGTAEASDVASHVIDQAAAVLEPLAETPLYARVDGVLQDDRFLLMELELIEPDLFLRLEPTAPERFARCLLQAL